MNPVSSKIHDSIDSRRVIDSRAYRTSQSLSARSSQPDSPTKCNNFSVTALQSAGSGHTNAAMGSTLLRSISLKIPIAYWTKFRGNSIRISASFGKPQRVCEHYGIRFWPSGAFGGVRHHNNRCGLVAESGLPAAPGTSFLLARCGHFSTIGRWASKLAPMTSDPIKVYDARWQVSEFDDAAVRRLFEATFLYGQDLGVDHVTLCRDARLGASRLLEMGVHIARRMGLSVWLCPDPVSTPHSYFVSLVASESHPNTMGLTITASHNPKDYIGVKFTVPVVRAIGLDCGPEGGLTKVREIYHSNRSMVQRPAGRLTLVNLRDDYIAYSAELAGVTRGSLEGLRVVLDTFHGSAGTELYRALDWAGVTVIPRRLVANGDFPSGSPNPTSQGKMDTAIELARTENAQVVLGVDGDGDRLVFGDTRGILSAGFAFIPILEQGLRRCGPASEVRVLYDPKVSPIGLVEWAKRGTRPLLFRNGHSQIKDYMLARGAQFAAEESGHYYHVLCRSGLSIAAENSLLVILCFLSAVKSNPHCLDELFALQSRVFTTGEFNYQFADDQVRDRALSAIVEMLLASGANTVTHTPDGIDLEGTCIAWGVTLSGVDAVLDPNWYSGYLRVATNENAVVRSYFSAGDPSRGRDIESQVRELLEQRFAGRVVD